MEIKTQGDAITCLIQAIPLPEQIKNIDLSYAPAIYFTWRSYRYKVELQTGSVDMVDGSMLVGNDCSILIRKLLNQELIKLYYS